MMCKIITIAIAAMIFIACTGTTAFAYNTNDADYKTSDLLTLQSNSENIKSDQAFLDQSVGATSTDISNSDITLILYNNGQFTMKNTSDGKWVLFPDATSYISINVDGTIYAHYPEDANHNVDALLDNYISTSLTQAGNIAYIVYTLPENVEITQKFELSGKAVKFTTEAVNLDGASHAVEVRYLFDTQLDLNDGSPLYAPGIGTKTYETDIPNPHFSMWKGYDIYPNPSFESKGSLSTQPDRMVFAYWPYAVGYAWDYTPDPNQRFDSDSCVLLYWDIGTLHAGGTGSAVTYYGVGEPGGMDISALEDALDRYQQKINEYMLRIASMRAESNSQLYKEFGAEYTNDLINYFGYIAERDGLTTDDVSDDFIRMADFTFRDLDKETANMIYNFLKEMFSKVDQDMDVDTVRDIFYTHYMGTADMQSNYFLINGATISKEITASNIYFDQTKPEIIQNLEQQGITPEEIDIIVYIIDEKINKIDSLIYLEGQMDEKFTSAIINGDDVNGYIFLTEYEVIESSVTNLNNPRITGIFTGIIIGIIYWIAPTGSPEDLINIYIGYQVYGTLISASNNFLGQIPANTKVPGVIIASGREAALIHGTIKNEKLNIIREEANDELEELKQEQKEKILNDLWYKNREITNLILHNINCDDLISTPDSAMLEGKQTGSVTIKNVNNIPFTPYLGNSKIPYLENSKILATLDNGQKIKVGTISFQEDIPEIGAYEEETIQFEYKVPIDFVVEECSVIDYKLEILMRPHPLSFFHTHTKSGTFKATSIDACELISSNIIAEGLIMSGDAEAITHTPNENTRTIIYDLMYPGSDLDLHLYDESGNHVGINYDTGQIEVKIPDATYSGPDFGLTTVEWIRISNITHENYVIEVVAMDTGRCGEDYSIAVSEIPELPAIVKISPDNINLESSSGESQEVFLFVKEYGGFNDLSGISITASDLTDSMGGSIPSSSLIFDIPSTAVQAGSAMVVNLTINIPTEAAGGRTYSGVITAEDDSGAVDTIQININVDPAECPLDMNDDGYINAQDIVHLLTHGEWGSNQGHVWDLNDDGYVNAQDIVYALTHGQWGACP